MPYITNWNHYRLTTRSSVLKKIIVKRLSGEFHTYTKCIHRPSIHTDPVCSNLKKDLIVKDESNGETTTLSNSGNTFVINYPVVKLNDNSFDEVDNVVEEYVDSLFFHAGFSECINCAMNQSHNSLTKDDLLSPEEWGIQYEKDLESLKKYFEDNPSELDSWHGLD